MQGRASRRDARGGREPPPRTGCKQEGRIGHRSKNLEDRGTISREDQRHAAGTLRDYTFGGIELEEP